MAMRTAARAGAQGYGCIDDICGTDRAHVPDTRRARFAAQIDGPMTEFTHEVDVIAEEGIDALEIE
jgi:hypothetical protein